MIDSAFLSIVAANSKFDSSKAELIDQVAKPGWEMQYRLSKALKPAWQTFQEPEEAPARAEFSQSLAMVPRTGSQLYMQRLSALNAGKLHTRLPMDSFSNAWLRAKTKPTYEQWRRLLAHEAGVVAKGQGNRNLSILVGDSLSLWFPSNHLPQNQIWLNQSISGDTTGRVLKRLSAFAKTRPHRIYVMVGVNDLKHGATDTEIAWNMRSIIRRLQLTHPKAQVIVQSILPTRSLKIPNDRIVVVNSRLSAIAQNEGAIYLDLYRQFVDRDGQMAPQYTTDGIHLSQEGYAAWRAAVQNADFQLALDHEE